MAFRWLSDSYGFALPASCCTLLQNKRESDAFGAKASGRGADGHSGKDANYTKVIDDVDDQGRGEAEEGEEEEQPAKKTFQRGPGNDN